MLEKITAAHPIECTLITYHVWWPGPGDPFWLANQTENRARTEYYNVTGVPAVKIDGFINGGSSGTWESTMLDRYGVPSPLQIDLSGVQQTETTGTITAQITNTSAASVTGNLHFVLIESGIPYAGESWTYVMRDFIPAGTEGEIITLTPGQSTGRDAAFTITTGSPPNGWVRANLAAIVFVQDDATKEILQASRIFFELNQPELRLNSFAIDDTGGGDGNGSLDPGEWAYLRMELTNINPVLATNVAGTLATDEPRLTVSDPSGTWPDIPFEQTEGNDADPFIIVAAPDIPTGVWIPLTLTVTAVNGYSTTLPLTIPAGSPTLPTGPTSYGYYAYEDSDPVPAAPDYEWMEIDPNLGGAGTLLTLYGDQTRTVTLPFTFRYEGTAYTTLSIGSNGWIAPGTTTDHSPANGYIPGAEGPPNMIAAFWTDLLPDSPEGGKVYTYHDANHHRYIVEYSRVKHMVGPAYETFEFILYDPVYYPTPTNDGEILLQYAYVGDASTCTVGIENYAETEGLQYLALGLLNPTAQGLAAGRAIKFSTVDPSGGASVDEGAFGPAAVRLSAHPNPVRGDTQIRYAIPVSGAVTLRVFDLEGALVRTLIDGTLPAGPGVASWDGRNERGRELPAGVYFYRLNGDGFSIHRKIVKD